MATSRLPGTVLRSLGAWPCTSALGLRTRRYSALRSKRSPLSNAIVSVLRSLCSRSSVGHGCEVSVIVGRSFVAAIVGWVELFAKPIGLRARRTAHDGFRIAREDGRKRPNELNPSYEPAASIPRLAVAERGNRLPLGRWVDVEIDPAHA